MLITLLIFALDESANHGTPTIRRFVAQQMAREVEMVELGEKKVVDVDVKPPKANNNNNNNNSAKTQSVTETNVKVVGSDNEADWKEANQPIEASSSIETTPHPL